LINKPHPLYVLKTLNFFMWKRLFRFDSEMARQSMVQRFNDEAALARPRHPGNNSQGFERNPEGHVFEIVTGSSVKREGIIPVVQLIVFFSFTRRCDVSRIQISYIP